MNRNESLQLQLATIIQEGHTSKATAYETAGRVLQLLNAEEDAERVNLHWPRFAVLPEKMPMASDLLMKPRFAREDESVDVTNALLTRPQPLPQG